MSDGPPEHAPEYVYQVTDSAQASPATVTVVSQDGRRFVVHRAQLPDLVAAGFRVVDTATPLRQ